MEIDPAAQSYRAGEGPVGVLLSHGFTGSVASLRPWAERLVGAGYRVSVPRLPGHGTSWQEMNRTAWPDWYATLERELADLRRDCDQVVAGGLSMGGALAIRLAEQHRDVRGLLLVNPAIATRDRRMAAVPLMARFQASVAAIGNDIAKPGVSEHAYSRTPLRALVSMLALQKDVRSRLEAVTCPTLLCVSDVDHVVDTSSRELLRGRLSDDQLEVVALHRSYHVATLDHDAEVIEEASLDFLRRRLEAPA